MRLEDLYRLMRNGHVQAQGVVDTMTQPVVVLDKNLCVAVANNAFIKTFQVERDEVVAQNFFELGNGQWDLPALRQLVDSVIPKAAAVIGFEVKHDFPTIGERAFLVDARRLVHPDDNSANILIMFEDVTERQRHEAEIEFTVSETRHRMKNLFAVVRAIAMETKTEDRTASEYRDTLLSRLEVAMRAQEIAAKGDGIDLDALIRQSIIGSEKRFDCGGPDVKVAGAKVPAISMIFHELATNAMKYGALSAQGGAVHVAWSLEPGPKGRTCLNCEWREEGGPTVAVPERRGYGTQLIEGTSVHLGGKVELNYKPGGLVAVIRIPL